MKSNFESADERLVDHVSRETMLLRYQNHALEMVLELAPLHGVLDFLLQSVENESKDGLIGCILLLDEEGDFRPGAGPQIPDSFNRAIDGVPARSAIGPCCQAALSGKPVVIRDIAADPQWTKFAQLAIPHGLKSCWSTPIFSSGSKVLGTFANYYREPRDPSPHDFELVRIITRTAALAIERFNAQEDIKKLHENLSRQVERYEDVVRELETSKAELTVKVDDLEKFHDVVVGRELRMMQLEKEMATLKAKLESLKIVY